MHSESCYLQSLNEFFNLSDLPLGDIMCPSGPTPIDVAGQECNYKSESMCGVHNIDFLFVFPAPDQTDRNVQKQLIDK